MRITQRLQQLHSCPDWDGLEVCPDSPEYSGCSCENDLTSIISWFDEVQLTQWAAAAVGITLHETHDGTVQSRTVLAYQAGGGMGTMPHEEVYNPQRYDLQAFDLAVQLQMSISNDGGRTVVVKDRGKPQEYTVVVPHENDVAQSTRRAITLCAAVYGGARYSLLAGVIHCADLTPTSGSRPPKTSNSKAESPAALILKEIEGNIEPAVRDIINARGNPNDIYDSCERIKAWLPALAAAPTGDFTVLQHTQNLLSFARLLLNDWAESEPDVSDIQAAAIKSNLLVAEQRTQACAESCNCASIGLPDGDGSSWDCYRLAPWLRENESV